MGRSVWRAMTAADLDAVSAIAAAIHPDLFESPTVFAEKLALYPAGCRILVAEGQPVGYVFSHPWSAAGVPPLNALLHDLPASPGTYYVHDLALLPKARGGGAAAAIVAALTLHATSAGLPSMSLVAVNGSTRFWSRHGFAVEDVPHLADKLAAYEAGARFMVRTLNQAP